MAQFYLDVKKAWKWRELHLQAEKVRIAKLDAEKREKIKVIAQQIEAIRYNRGKIVLNPIKRSKTKKIGRNQEAKR